MRRTDRLALLLICSLFSTLSRQAFTLRPSCTPTIAFLAHSSVANQGLHELQHRACFEGRQHRVATGHSRLIRTLNLRGGARKGTVTSLQGSCVGYAAALAGPAVSALGILIWEGSWKGSSFMLNTVKCTLASSLLLGFLLVQNGPALLYSMSNLGGEIIAPLLVSSFLGIIIGDLTWLAALKRLGSRRTILTDCARPVFAALVGFLCLGERLSLQAGAGVALATAGIVVAVSSSSSSDTPSIAGAINVGFILALTHLVLDTVGSALTKSASAGLNPSLVVLLRFGFASLALCATSAIMAVRSALAPPRDQVQTASVPGHSEPQWWEVPSGMAMAAWGRIALGCVLVTCLAPTLFVVSLQRLPLGLALTLASLGPLYEQPLSYLLHQRRPSVAGVAGAIIAVSGVALLCIKA